MIQEEEGSRFKFFAAGAWSSSFVALTADADVLPAARTDDDRGVAKKFVCYFLVTAFLNFARKVSATKNSNFGRFLRRIEGTANPRIFKLQTAARRLINF